MSSTEDLGSALLAAVRQIPPILDTHTEMLSHLIQLADPGPAEGGGIVDLLLRIEVRLIAMQGMMRRLSENRVGNGADNSLEAREAAAHERENATHGPSNACDRSG